MGDFPNSLKKHGLKSINNMGITLKGLENVLKEICIGHLWLSLYSDYASITNRLKKENKTIKLTRAITKV